MAPAFNREDEERCGVAEQASDDNILGTLNDRFERHAVARGKRRTRVEKQPCRVIEIRGVETSSSPPAAERKRRSLIKSVRSPSMPSPPPEPGGHAARIDRWQLEYLAYPTRPRRGR